MRAVLMVLVLLPTQSWALFQKIYDGYKNSQRLEQLKLSEKIISADLDLGENQFDWQLNMGANHTDSFLQRLFAFQFNQTITQTYSLGLSKSSYKYGTFNVSHSQIVYDLSNWSSSANRSFTGDTAFEVRNSVSYTYDFLNESLSLDYDELLMQNKANTVGQELTIDQDHLDFFNAYLNAKLRIMLDRLNHEFEKRAAKRVAQITSRVRDGLSRKVDLYSANLSLLTQKEAILKNESTLRESVAVIEDIIKVPIKREQYNLVDWTYKPSEKFTYVFEVKDYKEVERLKYLNEVTEIQLLKLDEQNSHSLNLNLAYTKNAFDAAQSEAMNEALGAGNNDEKVIGLTYTIPLGLDKRDALKRKLLFQKNQNDLRVTNRSSELEVQSKVLVENIQRYEQAIKILKQKVATAKSVVDENQRYYLRGQVSFEETLQSEVNFIEARVAQVNMYALYESALAQKAFLSGTLKKFLGEYKD